MKRPKGYTAQDWLDHMEQRPAEALALAEKLREVLAGNHPAAVYGALADCMSRFMAGTRPAMRTEMLARWLQVVAKFLPVSEREIFPDALPDGWERDHVEHIHSIQAALLAANDYLEQDAIRHDWESKQ